MSVAAPDLARGVVTPRLWTPPLRDLTPATSAGFEAVEFAEGVLGLSLIPWQRWLLEHMLELRADGTFRFRTVIVLVARQNGKTTLSQILSLWRMYVDGAGLVIGTAQNLDVAEEAWSATVELAESVPELASEIAAVERTNGKKALRLQTGERYKVAAASRRGGRGLSGDLVLLDELREHQKWDSWGAVTKTTMARPRAQIVCTSNAGDVSSVVLSHLRDQALRELADGSHASSDLGLFEWSAPDGCDVLDRAGWAQANPSMGYTITPDAVASAARTDPEPVFRTEVLCQWVEQVREPVIPVADWAACRDAASQMTGGVVFGVDVALDRSASWIVAAGAAGDGVVQFEVADARPGTAWVADRVADLLSRHPVDAVTVVRAGPAASLVPDLQRACGDVGVPLVPVTTMELPAACGRFHDLALEHRLRHLGDDRVDAALAAAERHWHGATWSWERKGAAVDAAPLVAATIAVSERVVRDEDTDPGVWVM